MSSSRLAVLDTASTGTVRSGKPDKKVPKKVAVSQTGQASAGLRMVLLHSRTLEIECGEDICCQKSQCRTKIVPLYNFVLYRPEINWKVRLYSTK
jgi:hypothetical protein